MKTPGHMPASHTGFSTALLQPSGSCMLCGCGEEIDLDSSVLSHFPPPTGKISVAKIHCIERTGKRNTQKPICHPDLLNITRLLCNVTQTLHTEMHFFCIDAVLRILSFLRTLVLHWSWYVKQFIEFADVSIFLPESMRKFPKDTCLESRCVHVWLPHILAQRTGRLPPPHPRPMILSSTWLAVLGGCAFCCQWDLLHVHAILPQQRCKGSLSSKT